MPANLTVYDNAGLARGASTGAVSETLSDHTFGLIFQVVRCFNDAEIIHVEENVDSVRDLISISEEVRIKNIEFIEKTLKNIKKQMRRNGQSLEMKKLKEEEAIIKKILLD